MNLSHSVVVNMGYNKKMLRKYKHAMHVLLVTRICTRTERLRMQMTHVKKRFC